MNFALYLKRYSVLEIQSHTVQFLLGKSGTGIMKYLFIMKYRYYALGSPKDKT